MISTRSSRRDKTSCRSSPSMHTTLLPRPAGAVLRSRYCLRYTMAVSLGSLVALAWPCSREPPSGNRRCCELRPSSRSGARSRTHQDGCRLADRCALRARRAGRRNAARCGPKSSRSELLRAPEFEERPCCRDERVDAVRKVSDVSRYGALPSWPVVWNVAETRQPSGISPSRCRQGRRRRRAARRGHERRRVRRSWRRVASGSRRGHRWRVVLSCAQAVVQMSPLVVAPPQE